MNPGPADFKAFVLLLYLITSHMQLNLLGKAHTKLLKHVSEFEYTDPSPGLLS